MDFNKRAARNKTDTDYLEDWKLSLIYNTLKRSAINGGEIKDLQAYMDKKFEETNTILNQINLKLDTSTKK